MTHHTGYRRFKKNPWELISEGQGEGHLDAEQLLRNLGHIIRQIRRQKKMTLEDLSELAGVNPKYLGEVELGKANPTVLFLQKVAWALKMEMVDLFFGCQRPQEETFIYGEIMGLLRRLDRLDVQRLHKILKVIVV